MNASSERKNGYFSQKVRYLKTAIDVKNFPVILVEEHAISS